ncbi:GNAT family N-acetyltransferase [Aggregicoccus sp. 17bor-14]|uniref:GNAT family N-acetyltransferase n=1 Tax=Myxococcaceae TaxID=31 RepID=UPI00129CB897|nr:MULTISPECIES: GNAT family N-acetyltransferase [Myxococcaceae]MBF5043041.1 hypothetical protein [Simulacricoccus sp. 17bor-14]MRI88804.1 GNAT family N-acetyltransferase [Aggregicoccus sp. 17bor-14]
MTLLSLSPDELAQDAALWTLYAQAFPASEREPPEVILRSLRLGVGRALAAREGGVTQGLAVLHLLQDPDVVFLVYLALAPGVRGQGRGGALLEAAWREGAAALAAQGRVARGLVWEVDPPETAPDAAERAVRERRLRFFTRAGAQPLPTAYLQPPLAAGAGPLPMRLLYRAATAHPVESFEPEALVRAMYAQKYGAVNRLPAALLEGLLTRG